MTTKDHIFTVENYLLSKKEINNSVNQISENKEKKSKIEYFKKVINNKFKIILESK
jgi:hypothetical protein